jgi:hypothetical protein
LSHCAAGSDHESGVSLILRQTATSSSLLGFASRGFRHSEGDTPPIEVIFDAFEEGHAT